MGQHPENYPEAIRAPQEPSTLPEVVPELDPTPQHVSEHDLSPQELFKLQAERDKYPAYYDTAPMFPYQGATPSPPLPEGHDLPMPYPENLNTAPAGFIMSPGSSVPWDPILPAGNAQVGLAEGEKRNEKRICGLKKRTFIIAVAVAAAVILAAIIGGIVGGVVSSKKSKDSDGGASSDLPAASGASKTSPSSSVPPTSATADGPAPTTTEIVNLANQTVPNGFAFQAYSEANFTGKRSPVFWLEEIYDIDFDAKSYIWLPNGHLQCCVTFCANATTATGYWCDERWRPEGSSTFRRVQLWCGRNDTDIAPIKQKQCSAPPKSTSVTTRSATSTVTHLAAVRTTQS
ncbi:hypothetical protein QBC42DRAFT_288318 [Cladorrhinum samala]|uniref:Uncharacterized protein n=1 Tax=Cladorrhinum samala TaxID=585594 RepID=A0AAV9HL03_9PEZI|nr:hypothetical protein QBC42DRAFT_288318 [Cladorrhinum samala]